MIEPSDHLHTHVFRAGAAPYIVWGTVSSLLSIFGIIVVNKNSSAWPGLAVFLGLGFIMFFWLSRHRVEIDNEQLKVRSLLGTRSCRLSDIKQVKIGFGSPEGSFLDRAGPGVRMLVRHVADGKPGQITINLQVFAPKDVRAMREMLDATQRP
jgi:hypothetical protein